jgi:hypothetical protein
MRNVGNSGNHWLNLKLIGNPQKKSPRDAIGSVVYLTIGKSRQRRDIISGAGYCSQNDMTVHFGLGQATKIDKLEVQWPNGSLETFVTAEVDKTLTIIEGKGIQR